MYLQVHVQQKCLSHEVVDPHFLRSKRSTVSMIYDDVCMILSVCVTSCRIIIGLPNLHTIASHSQPPTPAGDLEM